MKKDVIIQIQKLLTAIGYPLTPDGIWGKLSQAALDSACKAHGVGNDSNVPTNVTDTNVGGKTDFWADIKYFRREEFKCKCGGKYCNGYPAEMDIGLIRIADGIREHFGAEAIVSSGLRCWRWNALQGGVANSRHRYGKAIDFCVKDVSGGVLDAYIGALHGINYHYHISDGYCHMDVL